MATILCCATCLGSAAATDGRASSRIISPKAGRSPERSRPMPQRYVRAASPARNMATLDEDVRYGCRLAGAGEGMAQRGFARRLCADHGQLDRKSYGKGNRGSVLVSLCGRCIIKQKKH